VIFQRAGELPLGNAMLKADAALQTEYQARVAPGASALHETPNGRIFVADMPALEISSTDIRRRCADGKSVRYLVPDAVVNHINTQSLYRTC
jgi:nicotinate-nucleotide adenylyltransferase